MSEPSRAKIRSQPLQIIMNTTEQLSRRHLLSRTLRASAGFALGGWACASSTSLANHPSSKASFSASAEFPVRTITQGPAHHWFGYYDKYQFDSTNRHVLGMEVDFEHRSPKPDDEIKLGVIDLEDGDKWREFGSSTAWGWQQGCMLQWRPGFDHQVLHNDRGEDQFVCRVHDLESGETRTIDHPIYTVSPVGDVAMSADFRRINDMRPGYGYVGLPDPFTDQLAPEETGVFNVDLNTGNAKLVKSLAEIASFGKMPEDTSSAKHYVNHLLFNTDGSRLIFLHRWRFPNSGFRTRMLTIAPDGSDMRVIDANGTTSHFIWKNADQILAWSRQQNRGGFYVFQDDVNPAPKIVGADVMTRDGHCTYVPDTEWIINDTYPDRERNQTVYLYHPARDEKLVLGKFHSPQEYSGEWRCDTHPRVSRDGKSIVIDSPHTGEGRQMHLIDISAIHA